MTTVNVEVMLLQFCSQTTDYVSFEYSVKTRLLSSSVHVEVSPW